MTEQCDMGFDRYGTDLWVEVGIKKLFVNRMKEMLIMQKS